LRVEISCETDKKKINFIFNYSHKIFLTKKMRRACADGKRTNTRCEKIFVRADPHSQSQHEVSWAADPVQHLRVDRTGLCAQFPASASGRKCSVNCRCSELIVTSWGQFSCAAPVGTGR
jgi:hypothetical protein